MTDPNIEVQLTDDKTLHCFKVIYHVQIPGHEGRAPMEIFLHATQAFDLFAKLGAVLLEYFALTSTELLRKVFENNGARNLLKETLTVLQARYIEDGMPPSLASVAQKIDGFLAITEAVNHPPEAKK